MAVLSDAGAERAHVVGHDWGAALAWAFASLVPGPGRSSRRAVGRPPLDVPKDTGTAPRSRGTCSCSSSPASPSSGSATTIGPTSASWGRSPRLRGRDHRARGHEIPDARPQLVPGQRASGVLRRRHPSRCRPCRRRPWGYGAAATSPSPKTQMTDSAENVDRSLALRADRGPRPLDAAGGPRHDQPAPAGLPPQVRGSAGLTDNHGDRTELGHRSPARTCKPNEPSRSEYRRYFTFSCPSATGCS